MNISVDVLLNNHPKNKVRRSMKTADLITSYLNNEMTPEQERQFLLSVAASDSMRLSLKSHVMLDRIVTNQVQHTHVPESLRNAIFTQMAVSMPASAPAANPAASPHAPSSDAMRGGWRFFDGTSSWFGRGALVALFTLAGFAAGYLAHPEIEEKPTAASHSAPAQSMQRNDNLVPSVLTQAPPVVTDAQAAAEGAVVAETIPDGGSQQEVEAARATGTIRTAVRPQDVNRRVQLPEASGSVSSGQPAHQVLPSSPLDPSNRVRRTPSYVPKPEAGRTLADSASHVGAQPVNADVRAIIRKSEKSDSNKDSQERIP